MYMETKVKAQASELWRCVNANTFGVTLSVSVNGGSGLLLHTSVTTLQSTGGALGPSKGCVLEKSLSGNRDTFWCGILLNCTEVAFAFKNWDLTISVFV